MEFRLAIEKDLGQLKDVYEKVIKEMNETNIQIWDNIYPCQFIEDDIKSKRLYIMLNDEEIISSFALCDTNAGEDSIKWKSTSAKALYLDRFAVNIKYSKKE